MRGPTIGVDDVTDAAALHLSFPAYYRGVVFGPYFGSGGCCLTRDLPFVLKEILKFYGEINYKGNSSCAVDSKPGISG